MKLKKTILVLWLSAFVSDLGAEQWDALADFLPARAANWSTLRAIDESASRDGVIRGTAGLGVFVSNPTKTTRSNLLSRREHGDVIVTVEFWLPQGGNAGVYLQGRYEIQLFDSWGKENLTYADCGGIYARGRGEERVGGVAPKSNASRQPGSWQQLAVTFRAPRFDSSGTKRADAVFVKVELNGVLVQENAAVEGPTRASAFPNERPLGPLMLQGDHSAVAFRNLNIREIDAP